jgi:hypothetical protein
MIPPRRAGRGVERVRASGDIERDHQVRNRDRGGCRRALEEERGVPHRVDDVATPAHRAVRRIEGDDARCLAGRLEDHDGAVGDDRRGHDVPEDILGGRAPRLRSGGGVERDDRAGLRLRPERRDVDAIAVGRHGAGNRRADVGGPALLAGGDVDGRHDPVDVADVRRVTVDRYGRRDDPLELYRLLPHGLSVQVDGVHVRVELGLATGGGRG